MAHTCQIEVELQKNKKIKKMAGKHRMGLVAEFKLQALKSGFKNPEWNGGGTDERRDAGGAVEWMKGGR